MVSDRSLGSTVISLGPGCPFFINEANSFVIILSYDFNTSPNLAASISNGGLISIGNS